jgi:hypothetical protein
MTKPSIAMTPERVAGLIYLIRGEKVMLDADLADLYRVETKQLVRQVKRNIERFPSEFMFQLSAEEFTDLRCQIGTSNMGRGGRRTPPYCFTEQGVAMLSSVLRSKRAISVNIEIMKAFVRLRQMIASHVELSRKMAALERRSEHHDQQFRVVFEAIRELSAPRPVPTKKGHKLGF